MTWHRCPHDIHSPQVAVLPVRGSRGIIASGTGTAWVGMGEPLVSAWLCRGSPPAPPYSRGDKPKGKSARFLNPGRCPAAPRHPQSYDGGQWVPPRAQGGWERGWLGAGRVKCAQPGGTGIKGPVVPGAGSAPQGLLREPCAASWGAARAPSSPPAAQLPTGLSQGQHLPAPDVTGQAGMESPHVPALPTGAAGAAPSPGNGLWGHGLLPHLFFWESIPIL